MANSEVMFTQLPVTSEATMTDIIAAVQGYASPSNPGILYQETLQQVFALFNNNIVLYYSGNPNGNLAGNINQFCWDLVNHILYLCTSSGDAASAIWSKTITLTAGTGITILQSGNNIQISAVAESLSFNNITTSPYNMVSNNAYQADSSSTITLALPVTSSFGDRLFISGYGEGGWTIAQGDNQQIIVGTEMTTPGLEGSLSSTNQYDGIALYCAVANTIWKNIDGPQGCLTYV
jgi:hypothetical protein